MTPTTDILITGATGKTGREVAALLAGRDGVSARAASRSGNDVAGVPGVRFDWQQPATWAAAVGDADRVYLVRPDLPDSPELIAAFLDAAPAVRRVVLLSEIGCGKAEPEHWERRIERAVTDRAAQWTLLRPNWFTQTLTEPQYFGETIRAQGELVLPTRGAAIAFVDTRDIAAVAVAALLEDGHHGAAYEITGPEALTLDAVAELVGAAAGRPVRAVDPPVDTYLAELGAAGYDATFVAAWGRAFGRVADGTDAQVSDAVERVTGRPPRSLRAYVEAHADAWREAPVSAG